MVAVLASVAMVVVKALSHSSWGMFTILLTIPAALLTGAWMYKIRPGHIVEASIRHNLRPLCRCPTLP